MIDINLILLSMLAAVLMLLGLFVLLKSRRDIKNRYFFLIVVTIVAWLVANYLSNASFLGESSLLIWNKAVFIFPSLTVGFVLMFSLSITNLDISIPKWALRVALAISILIAALCTTSFVVNGISKDNNQVYGIVFGPLSVVYFAYTLVYICAIFLIFWYALKRAERAQRARLEFIIAGICVSLGIAAITNLIAPFIFHDYALVGFGPYATLVLASSFAYAILRQRLFEVRLVVAKSVAYVLLLFTLTIVFGASIFLVFLVLFPNTSVVSGQMLVISLIALMISAAFQPLQRFFQRTTDGIFYRDNYDSQYVINKFSKILVSERDLDRILKRSITELCEQLHIQFGQLVVYNNERVYRIEHFGKLPKRLMVAPELEQLNKPMLIADELTNGPRKQLMEDHGIRVSLTLQTRDEFVAYLLLGDKLSGDIYSTQDIDLLEIIGKELAVAILNAKAYAQIEEFNQTLQERVDHATSRLRVANRHLKELDRAKDEFISMASHQLRTPLTTIKGYLSMMQEGDAGKLNPAQAEFVGYAYGSSERMVNLISDLLNVSRLSAGRFLIQTKPTDMVAMISDEVRQLATHASAKGIGLIFEPPKEPLPPAEIDDNKTRQVVMNFIDNAIYYTQKGEVRVVLEQSGDKVRLEVHDSGIGVPEKAKKKLFGKFFRADNAQIVRPDGTGLGLYLAKRVVEDQGGTILFSSIEGKGSIFGFELPFKPVSPIREVPHAR